MPAIHSRKGKGRAIVEEKVIPVLPLGKQLAHTDKKVRDRAVQNLAAFLSRGAQEDGSEEIGIKDVDQEGNAEYVHLSESEMAKLWKGLFYCFWMSDKPLVQQALATELSDLLLSINPRPSSSSLTSAQLEMERFRASLGFLDGFWKAMIREWGGIDRLRMDKFYLLIRRYLNATFRLMARTGWKSEAIEAVNSMYSSKSGPMTYQDPRVPYSIATHLADIFLEELDQVLGLPEVNSQAAAPLASILNPFIILLTRTQTSQVHTRIMDTIFVPLIKALTSASPSLSLSTPAASRITKDEPVYSHIVLGSCVGSSGVENRSSPRQVRKAVLDELFKFASGHEANESCRRKVYKFWREEGGDEEEEEEDDDDGNVDVQEA